MQYSSVVSSKSKVARKSSRERTRDQGVVLSVKVSPLTFAAPPLGRVNPNKNRACSEIIEFQFCEYLFNFPAEISLGFQGTRRSDDCKFMPLSASVNAYKLIRSSLEQSRSGMAFVFQWYMRHLSTFSKLVLCLISVILLAFYSYQLLVQFVILVHTVQCKLYLFS